MEIQDPTPAKSFAAQSDRIEEEIEQKDVGKKAALRELMSRIDSNILGSEELDILTKLRKQIEFYLGDSNLSNDKFLVEQVTRNPKHYVDLSLFLQFNKVKGILGDVSDVKIKMKMLTEAISNSSILKLNKDKTKVRRRVPFESKSVRDSIAKRTVYVEDFPTSSTHETLAAIFGKVGHILHISLPKFSESRQAKGFAFIEYEVK